MVIIYTGVLGCEGQPPFNSTIKNQLTQHSGLAEDTHKTKKMQFTLVPCGRKNVWPVNLLTETMNVKVGQHNECNTKWRVFSASKNEHPDSRYFTSIVKNRQFRRALVPRSSLKVVYLLHRHFSYPLYSLSSHW